MIGREEERPRTYSHKSHYDRVTASHMEPNRKGRPQKESAAQTEKPG